MAGLGYWARVISCKFECDRRLGQDLVSLGVHWSCLLLINVSPFKLFSVGSWVSADISKMYVKRWSFFAYRDVIIQPNNY